MLPLEGHGIANRTCPSNRGVTGCGIPGTLARPRVLGTAKVGTEPHQKRDYRTCLAWSLKCTTASQQFR